MWSLRLRSVRALTVKCELDTAVDPEEKLPMRMTPGPPINDCKRQLERLHMANTHPFPHGWIVAARASMEYWVLVKRGQPS